MRRQVPLRRTQPATPAPALRDPRTAASRRKVVLDALRPHLRRGAWNDQGARTTALDEAYRAVECDVRTYLADALDAHAEREMDETTAIVAVALGDLRSPALARARALRDAAEAIRPKPAPEPGDGEGGS